ncbi:PKD domain containing protein [Mucilaginibacter paludis DSM 18603]|uniref:PKD domain containing protein n=2 Tax=Mucilaginibacter TaxID=423349 RepID=H1YIE1_9SPHI|nr:PKD domain containing protein [Mucilaginibacter paludis DSM 18603]
MKILKYLSLLLLPLVIIAGCKREQFTDTSFVTSATPISNVSVMFNITHDNTGLVTITPNGTGAVTYDVYYGDATVSPASVPSGQSITHTYAEGNYQVKIVGHDMKGGTLTITQPLVVSFLAPQNLATKVSTSNLTVNVSATAKYATLFKVYFGDSTNITPIPSTNMLPGVTITHNYVSAGTYIVKVIALSGGAATTQHLDTIKVSKQINLPVTFEDANANYTMSDFGGNASSLAIDPQNAANHVMKSIKTAGAQTWAGTTIGTAAGFASVIPLNAANLKMTVMVYSPAAGLDIKLKLDNHANANNGLSVETDVKSTVANQWETLTFDFSKPASGTAAWSASNTYDLASIFFDFGNNGTGSTFYFDNLMMAPPSLSQISLPTTFDDATVDYTVTDFGGNTSALVTDPVNSSNHVIKSIKTSGAQVWAGTTIGTALGFSSMIPVSASHTKMSVKVYSPAAGLHIRLKIEDHTDGSKSVETEALTTVANQWETLTFDFSNQASGTTAVNYSYHYDKASIFFDFGNAGSGSVFYWDSVTFL